MAAFMAHAASTPEQERFILSAMGTLDLRDQAAVDSVLEELARLGKTFGVGREGFDVVFVNNLDRCNPDSDGVTDMGPIVAALIRIAHVLGCALIVLAVQNPRIDDRPAPVGSSRLSEEAQGMALLTRTKEELTLRFADSDVVGKFRREPYRTQIGGVESLFTVVADDADRVEPESTDKKRGEFEERLMEAAHRLPKGTLPKLTRLFDAAGINKKEHGFARKVVNQAAKQGDWITKTGNKFVLVA
jgi:hypothetical protein